MISVKVPQPQFEGQTKGRLNSDIAGQVQQLVNDKLGEFFEKNPSVMRKIVSKAIDAARARREQPARLAISPGARELSIRVACRVSWPDCQERDPDRCELFLVESESAGGTAKQGRDRRFQAILPSKGKILNVEKARYDRMLGHEEIRCLITAMGTGIGKDDFDASKLRYGKIIIAVTDADVDGSHIRTLLLTFLLPPHERADREGPRLHRAASAIPDPSGARAKSTSRTSRSSRAKSCAGRPRTLSLNPARTEPAAGSKVVSMRAFLMNLDEFQQIFHKLQRRLREERVVEALADAALRIDNKADFTEKANMEILAEALKKAGVDAAVEVDEEHSAWYVRFHDATNAPRRVDTELSHHPEFRKYRNLAEADFERQRHPPFTGAEG